MHILGYAGLYLFYCAVFFWIFYKLGLEMNSRHPMEFSQQQAKETSTWRYLWNDEKATWRIFAHDFFKLHCPWNWQAAMAARVIDARKQLEHSEHEKGWKLEDCDNPANHEQIAKDCFISRKRFWGKHIFLFLTMPIRGVLAAAGLVIVLVILMPLQWLWNKIPRKLRDYEKEIDEGFRKSSVEEIRHALWHARNDSNYWNHNIIVKLSHLVSYTIPERFRLIHYSYMELETTKDELEELVQRMKRNLFWVSWQKVLESNDIRAVQSINSGQSCWPEDFAQSGIDPEMLKAKSREAWQLEANRLCQSLINGRQRRGEQQIADLESLYGCAYELKIPYWSQDRNFGLDHDLLADIMYENFEEFCYANNITACMHVLVRHLHEHVRELESGNNSAAQACLERFFSHPHIGETAEPDDMEKIRQQYESWKSRSSVVP